MSQSLDTRPQSTRPEREQIAARLLGGSLRRSYDSVIDIDWAAPLDPHKYFLPPEVISLYGTPLWNEMTEAQRIELSRQELAATLSMGIWFENVLNRALLSALLYGDASSLQSHYTLTEMGDECRHMVMFGRTIDAMGARPYRLDPVSRIAVRLLPAALRGSLLWVAALVGEEIFDASQRATMRDPELQPLIARMMQIHVTEEARHIRFARESLVRRLSKVGRTEKLVVGSLHGLGALLFDFAFTNPAIYRRAGLDPKEARRQARANPNARVQRMAGFASLGAFLDENGLMAPISRRLWQRTGFLG